MRLLAGPGCSDNLAVEGLRREQQRQQAPPEQSYSKRLQDAEP